MRRLRVLIADDSSLYRRILDKAVRNAYLEVDITMVGNGLEALEELPKKRYDVVLLDVNMPVMDGITALEEIKKKYYELPVIMISATGTQSAKLTMQALEKGALDFIVKPIDENFEKNLEFVSGYLKKLFDQIVSKSENSNVKKSEKVVDVPKLKKEIGHIDLVVIASSTGGPSALEKIFFKMDKSFSKPMLLVQHMPPEFTRVFAENLNKKSAISISEGKEDDVIRAGMAIIAPGGYHMVVERVGAAKRVVKLLQTPHICGVRPAANVLFQSVAKEYQGQNILAVILTGMGNDGVEGVKALKMNTNCYCITQSEETCTIFGMPRCAVEAGISDEIVDIENIATRIQQIAEQGR